MVNDGQTRIGCSETDGATVGCCIVKDSFYNISEAFLHRGLPSRKEPGTLPHGISGGVLVTKRTL